VACPGGIVLDWSATEADGFGRYGVARSASDAIPAVWPPSGGASAVDAATTTDPSRTSAADTGRPAGSTWFYRAFVLGDDDRVLAASAVRSAVAKPVKPLGALSVAPEETGTAFAWAPYAGDPSCVSYLKLVMSADDPTPSYLEGAGAIWVGENAAAGETWVEGLDPGTYWFRLQAIRATDLGKFVVAETDPVAYAVP
jgi:hypothetical protein